MDDWLVKISYMQSLLSAFRGACICFNTSQLARIRAEQAEKVPLNLNRLMPA